MSTHQLASTGLRLVAITLLGSVIGLAFPSPAHADTTTISINTGSGWVHDSSTPLFDVTRLAPGFTQTQTLMVRNDAADLGDLALSASDIVENENGCMHSEALVDSTCGATQGELGHELVFNVFLDPENDGSYQATPAWTGTLYDLAAPVSLLTGLPGGGIAGLRVVMTLPASSGNETQTDDVDFSFRLSLTGAGVPGSPEGPPGSSSGPGDTSGSGPSTGPGTVTTPQGPGSVEVKGVKHVRHQHHSVLADIASQLPFTGSPIERMVAGGMWLLIAGAALSMLATIRRRRRTQPN
jgi:hypothetical protein